MPQFDIFFIYILVFLIFWLFVYFYFWVFCSFFNNVFKVKNFNKNFYYQQKLIMTLKKEIDYMVLARRLWIKKKLIESYDI